LLPSVNLEHKLSTPTKIEMLHV